MKPTRPFYFAIADDQLEAQPMGTVMECLRYDAARVYANDSDGTVPVGFTIFESEHSPRLDRWASFGITVAAVGRDLRILYSHLPAWRAANPEQPDSVSAFCQVRDLCFTLYPPLRENPAPMALRITSFIRGLAMTSSNKEIGVRAIKVGTDMLAASFAAGLETIMTTRVELRDSSTGTPPEQLREVWTLYAEPRRIGMVFKLEGGWRGVMDDGGACVVCDQPEETPEAAAAKIYEAMEAKANAATAH